MKIKDGTVAYTSDFWYDLFEGGYLHPEQLLETRDDAVKVLNAIAILRRFKQACEEQIEDFIQ